MKKPEKRKGKWSFDTFWLLVNNEWICTKDKSDFNKLRNKATLLEKRTSFWNGNMYLGTTSTPIRNKPKRNRYKSKS